MTDIKSKRDYNAQRNKDTIFEPENGGSTLIELKTPENSKMIIECGMEEFAENLEMTEVVTSHNMGSAMVHAGKHSKLGKVLMMADAEGASIIVKVDEF